MRHAVYFAPPIDQPLWRAGCVWLGRPEDGVGAGRPPRDALATAWRYGFHATLKAPMRLAEGRTVESWREAMQRFVRGRQPFRMPPLQVAPLGTFLALRPTAALPAESPLRRLADACLEAFDPWRAPLDDIERRRHLKGDLSHVQRDHVERYGYAHVLEHWRFHMTLGDDVAEKGEAEQHFARALTEPLLCDAICWFVEPAPGAPFQLRQRFPFRP